MTKQKTEKKPKKKYPKIKISKTLFRQFTNEFGEINQSQANLLRVDWPLRPDWKDVVLGKEISYPVRGMLLKFAKPR